MGSHWYKDAVIYELDVRSFYDSNGDGAGDFLGLIDKLYYLQELGATAVVLGPPQPISLEGDGRDPAGRPPPAPSPARPAAGQGSPPIAALEGPR